jgi:hypothetical protein
VATPLGRPHAGDRDPVGIRRKRRSLVGGLIYGLSHRDLTRPSRTGGWNSYRLEQGLDDPWGQLK